MEAELGKELILQIKITTDYAIRTLCYLAEKNEHTTSSEIAKVMCIPGNYLVNFIAKLRDCGLITAKAGYNGGYHLSKKPKDITLMKIFQVMEKTVRISRCLEDDEHCNRDAVSFCKVHEVYVLVQRVLDSIFEAITVETLTQGTIKDRQKLVGEIIISEGEKILAEIDQNEQPA